MGRMRTRLSTALRESTAEHVYASVIGDQVPHVHEHVIARWPDTPAEHRGPMRVLEWPGAPRMNEQGLELFAERLRSRLASD
jgi:histidine triad (HIT) family protein